MSVGVGNPVEDGVVLKEQFEAAEVLAQSQDQEQAGGSEGEGAPGKRSDVTETSAECARAAGDKKKEHGEDKREHGHRQEPAGDQLPRGQGKEIEVKRPVEDRVGKASR